MKIDTPFDKIDIHVYISGTTVPLYFLNEIDLGKEVSSDEDYSKFMDTLCGELKKLKLDN